MEPIKLLANPNNVRPKRFWGVYTKLKIFNMTSYKKGKLFIDFFFSTIRLAWPAFPLCSFVEFALLIYILFPVVYLDADTIVVKSIEDLFKCGKFCANLKHSERMNSGVMVVEPSEALFKDMMSKVKSLPSYTGGLCFHSFLVRKQEFLLTGWF